MDKLVSQYYSAALAPSTQRSYQSAHRRYLEFCTSFHLIPIPLPEDGLCRFVAYLAGDGVAHKSIKCYLAALRNLHVTLQGNDPRIGDMPVLHYVLQGIKRSQALLGQSKARVRLPITAELMRSLKRSWETKGATFDSCMFWAVACTCFFGFLRSGEATVPTTSSYDPGTHLSMSDVAVDSPGMPAKVFLRIKASKTDPWRKGVTICLGRTGLELCPVAALIGYVARRGTNPGPLFRFENGQPLTRPALVREIRGALEAAGFDGSLYAGHSFRIGAATSAAAAGVEDSLIKILGRWQSSAYTEYVKVPQERLANLSARLAAGNC